MAHKEENPDASIRSVAELFNVSRDTLRRRLQGVPNRAAGHANEQLLSSRLKDKLVEWILWFEKCGHAPGPAQVHAMASLINVKLNFGDSVPESVVKRWVSRFLKRYSTLRSKKGLRLAQDRARCANPEDIGHWFDRFERVRSSNAIESENIWNMDESGLYLGTTKHHRVIGSIGSSSTYVKDSGNREWVTSVECVSAKGAHTKCLVVFKGKNVQNTWLHPDDAPDWYYATTDSAWTNSELGLQWLKKLFLPETAPTEQRAHRLLLCDGHSSHMTPEFIWECYINDVDLVYLPAHTSHVLQPLDLSVFSRIKASYRAQVAEMSRWEDAMPVKKQRFVVLYNNARGHALSRSYICGGWRGAGLRPWNPKKVLNSTQLIDATQGVPSTPEKRPRSASMDVKTPQNKRQLLEIL